MFPLTLVLLATGAGCGTGTTGGETSTLDTGDSAVSSTGDSNTTGGLDTGDTGTDETTDTEPSEPDYTCGWPRNDPGTLVSTGALTGDVIDNLLGYDQCGEVVELWDLFGSYNLVFIAGAW